LGISKGYNSEFGSNKVMDTNLRNLINFDERLYQKCKFRLVRGNFDPSQEFLIDLDRFLTLHKLESCDGGELGPEGQILPKSELRTALDQKCPFWGEARYFFR
jgi:hypothetical protein